MIVLRILGITNVRGTSFRRKHNSPTQNKRIPYLSYVYYNLSPIIRKIRLPPPKKSGFIRKNVIIYGFCELIHFYLYPIRIYSDYPFI